MPYLSVKPNSKAAQLCRTLISLRTKAKLTPLALAKAVGAQAATVEAYESGSKVPTAAMLGRLTAVFQCEDLAARFIQVPAIPTAQLARKENVALRVEHLINIVAAGHQTTFAAGAGVSNLSPVVNRHQPLSAKQTSQILAALPTLRPEWLAEGDGQPFTDSVVPTFARVRAKPEPIAEAKPTKPTVRYVDVPVMQALPIWDPNLLKAKGGVSAKEMLDSLAQRLEVLAARECGMSPAQVKETLGMLEYAL